MTLEDEYEREAEEYRTPGPDEMMPTPNEDQEDTYIRWDEDNVENQSWAETIFILCAVGLQVWVLLKVLFWIVG